MKVEKGLPRSIFLFLQLLGKWSMANQSEANSLLIWLLIWVRINYFGPGLPL